MDALGWTIPERECWELLASVSVGRVALSVRALPAILPVQYYLDGRMLAVCLGHRELPASSLDDTVVAFAADAIDPASRSGWSVQVQGRSALARELRLDAECGWPAAGVLGPGEQSRPDPRSAPAAGWRPCQVRRKGRIMASVRR